MKRIIRVIMGAAAVLAACSGDARLDEVHVGQSSAALAAGATIPEPLATPNAQVSAWDGTIVDLMAMDTWARCGIVKVNGVDQAIDYQLIVPTNAATQPVPTQPAPMGDVYLSDLQRKASQIMANRVSANPAAPSPLKSWMDYRNDPSYNRNSATHQAQSASLSNANLTPYSLDLNDATVNSAQQQATGSVALAAMNACIAQGVRTLALNGNTLVMTEAEQMQALELVRERAQIAMLQYAAIFNALASPGPAFTGTANTYQAMAYLQKWGAAPTTAGQAALAKWVTDFAAMMQLHLEVTGELANLFQRSAAAKSARGGTAVTRADEVWGAGSWRQRLLALLYGGDPLAAENSTPWKDMAGRADPGVPLDDSLRAADPWPSRSELPYFSVDASDPHVAQFFALAQQNSALRILNASNGAADVQTSAEWMYRTVEAALRTQQCVSVSSGACRTFALADIPAWTAPTGITPMETYLLYSTLGITSDHAIAATKLLDEYTATYAGPAAIHTVGALATATDASGAWRVVPREASFVPRSLMEVAPVFERYSPYRIPVTVDPNIERTHFETSSNDTVYRTGDDQGLAAGGVYAESMRTLGAVPALSMVRDVIRRTTASTTASTWLKTPMAKLSAPLMAAITGAIGAYSTRVTPIEATYAYNWGQYFTGGRSVAEKLQTIKVQRSPTVVITAGWAVDADVDPATTFFQPASGVTLKVVAIPNDATAYGLTLSADARRLDGKGIGDLVAGTPGVLTAAATVQNNVLHAELFVPAVPLSRTAAPPTWTFVAQRVEGTTTTYAPLTSAVPVYAWQFNRAVAGSSELSPILAYHFAGGGQFGRVASRVWETQRSDPSKPAYDGFGLPYTWVPSADATAFGSQAGDSVMTYFLRNAETAAQQATQAVQAAITSSQQAAQATLEQQAAQARSDLVLQQQAQTVCGAAAGTSACDVGITRTNLPFITWTPLADAWTHASGAPDTTIAPAVYCTTADMSADANALRVLDCAVRKRIMAASTSIPLAVPVAAVANSGATQTFDAWAGGQLQGELVAQWASVRRLVDVAQKLETNKRAAAARIQSAKNTEDQLGKLVEAAQKQLTGLTDEQQAAQALLATSGRAMWFQCAALVAYVRTQHWDVSHSRCTKAGVAWGLDLLAGDGNQVVDNVECFTSMGAEVDTGPAYWPQLKTMEASCLQAKIAFDQAQQQATKTGVMAEVQKLDVTAAQDAVEAAKGTTHAAEMDALEAVQTSAADMDSALAELARSVASIAAMRQQAKLAIARQNLESAIASQSADLSSGMYRQYNQYDWWRARALLDGARRYGVAARRAIETQYVARLDTLLSPEPFVAAPASWADDVYRYDLSMPSAVGLNTGNAIAGAQYPNQVLDYVGNLERFVQGFAVERPMTAASDNEILTIPGPGSQVVVGGQVVADPARAMWSVLCPAGAACASPNAAGWCPLQDSVSVAQTCASTGSAASGAPVYLAPTKIRASLLLDAWGRRISDTTAAPFKARVNARWGRFSVNLVGNGIRDCSTAKNPNRCQASQYLTYDLRHVGPALAVGATQQWTLLDIPLAQVESGKGATLGEFLDVEQNGWGKPFVEAIARAEFIGRPMNGAYVLELQGDEGTNFDAIVAAQVLLASNYWVMQQ